MFNFATIQRTDISRPDEFASPAVRRLYEWWLEFAPGIPKRSDFDILDMTDVAAHLFLVQMVEPGVFEFRLRGERVAELVGVRGSGDRCCCDDQEDTRHKLAEYYQDIVATRAPLRCLGSFVEGSTFATAFESVDCPLVDDDGAVTHIIGAIDKASSTCG